MQSSIGLAVLIVVFICVFTIPTIVRIVRRHRNKTKQSD